MGVRVILDGGRKRFLRVSKTLKNKDLAPKFHDKGLCNLVKGVVSHVKS
jgi:hypothetical protein